MSARPVSTFDDWMDLFYKWQKDIGFDASHIKDYEFDALYADPPHSEITFGEFKGRNKWTKVLEIPNQEMRDALLHLIVYQGDTEFASTEQQRHLVNAAPTEYDRQCLLRVMREEQCHGWQMCHLLVTYFGDSGKLEAANCWSAGPIEGRACSARSTRRSSISSNFSSTLVLSTGTGSGSWPFCAIAPLRRWRAA